MRQFIAETKGVTMLRAWLNPEDPNDCIEDPYVPRPDGWRIVFEQIEPNGTVELLRSTWEETLQEALGHMETYWPGRAVWKDYSTGEVVDLKLR